MQTVSINPAIKELSARINAALARKEKSAKSDMALARDTLASEDAAIAFANALTLAYGKWEAMESDARKASGIPQAIAAMLKDASTECAHCRAAYRTDKLTEAQIDEKLVALYPFRVRAEKGVKGAYEVVTHARFVADNAARRRVKDAPVADDAGDADADNAAAPKNADKAAIAIDALLAQVAALTIERDNALSALADKTRECESLRADLTARDDEALLAELAKPIAPVATVEPVIIAAVPTTRTRAKRAA